MRRPFHEGKNKERYSMAESKEYMTLPEENGSINISELARLAQVSRPTAYRYIKALK